MAHDTPKKIESFQETLTTEELVIQKLIDAETTPGFGASFSPEEAEFAGAFVEDALTEQDIMDAIEEPGHEQ